MNISKEEYQYEESHLSQTKDIIEDIIATKNVDIEDYKTRIVERKRFLWEHQNEFIDSDLCSLMNEEDMNVSLVNDDITKVYKLYRSLETPYFSRIDFESDNKKNTYYIGLTGVDKEYEPVVYDWRAAVANLYYNYGLGESQYESDEGLVLGTTTLKRQFDIRLGNLLSVYDNEVGVNDILLESVLAGNTDLYMRNIVDTIQKEQNDIIRASIGTDLIVEGVAGSGKTSVALHRIAYLLYNQKNLTNKNVLIFSPSEIFTEYISSVLPELGEENVATTTFKDFAANYIKGIKIESLVEFIERCYESNSKDKQLEEMLSFSYRDKIDRFLSDYFLSLKFTKKLGLKTSFLSASELNNLKNRVPSKLSFYDRIEYLSEKVCEYFQIDEVKNAAKIQKILRKILGVIVSPIELWESFIGKRIDKVNYEEIFAILYLYFEVNGYPSMSQIKLLVIDEAQDYSLWQFAFIKKIFNNAKFTILGDRNQSINPYLKYSSLEDIKDIFGSAKYKQLKNTYRSSKEIIEFANHILNLKDIHSIRKSNGIDVIEKKEKNLHDDLSSDITLLRDKGLNRIAIITKNEEEKNYIESLLTSLEVDIIPVYLAKGLEYDGVIIYTDLSNKYLDSEKNLFYVACTRALHALVVYNQL
ncbi:MAG: UvrD-helicase domain-containing protein [Bacilli bacterium]|nr:UvrD-helicase domain-containing protein [Bacilli bacterium]